MLLLLFLSGREENEASHDRLSSTLTSDILLQSDNLLLTPPKLMVPLTIPGFGSGWLDVEKPLYLKMLTFLFVLSSCPTTNIAAWYLLQLRLLCFKVYFVCMSGCNSSAQSIRPAWLLDHVMVILMTHFSRPCSRMRHHSGHTVLWFCSPIL